MATDGQSPAERPPGDAQQGWTAPAGDGSPGAQAPFAAPGPFPASGPFAPPGSSAPPVGQAPFGGAPAQPPLGAPTGWTPPPKPGLIPLRPLGLGDVLAASVQVLRRNPKPTFGASLLLQSASFLLAFLVIGLVAYFTISRVATALPEDQETIAAGGVAIGLAASIIPVALAVVLGAVLQGVIVLDVARGTLGEKLTFGELWRSARGRLGTLVGWALLLGLAILVAVVAVSVVAIALVAFGGDVGAVLVVPLALVAYAVAIAATLWLGTKLGFVPSAIVLERLGLAAAVRRSWTLTTGLGTFWRVLGIQVLVGFIVSLIGQVVSVPVTFLLPLLVALVAPTGDPVAVGVVGVGGLLVSGIVLVAFGAAALVVQTATTALLYLDLRIRREGLDLDLQRFVEARAAGRDLDDPYAARPSGATPAAGPWS